MLISEDERIWYSPMQLIKFADYALKHNASKQSKKMIDEMLPVAVATIGLAEISGKAHWLQHVSEKKQAPDLRSLYQEKKDRKMVFHISDIEVVTLGPYSNGDDIAQFILDTKLNNPKKAYDERTIFICHLNRKLNAVVSEISNKLTAYNKPQDVFLIGLIRYKNVYQFSQVNPKIGPTLIINLNKRVNSQLPAIYSTLEGSKTLIANSTKNPYI